MKNLCHDIAAKSLLSVCVAGVCLSGILVSGPPYLIEVIAIA
jgi:hypothetical protein